MLQIESGIKLSGEGKLSSKSKSEKDEYCPYCGYKMKYSTSINPEGAYGFWSCPKCGLTLFDRPSRLPPERRSELRKTWRAYLRQKIKSLREELKRYQNKYSMYAKFFKDEKEVTKAVVEELQSRSSR